ncbi:hypothetical protein BH10CYA1_BH10CYA1_36110 [soil metagenome]
MSFDAPDLSKKIAQHDDAVSLLKLSGQAFLHSAIQSPMEGVTQLVNKVADREVLPCPKLIDAPDPVQFGGKAWVAETIGSGLGMVAPFLLTEKVSGAMLSKAGLISESAAMSGRLGVAGLGGAEVAELGRIGNAIKFSTPAARMAVAGALFGLVLTPSMDPTRDFWEQRGVSAASSAITFGAMGLVSGGLTAGIESRLKVSLTDSAMQSSLQGIGLRIGTNAIGGAVGGVASAESNSLLSGKGFASQDEVMRSVASYMVTGAGLDAAHIALHKGGELLARNEVKNLDGERVAPKLSAEEQQMLDKIQRAHFEYFKQQSDPDTGLTKDRSTDSSPASIAAVGFSLTAHPVAVSRGWISREEATDYTLKVLKNLSESPQGPAANGTSGDHGFFYHFLDPKTGLRQGENELSTVDTALLMGGVLFAKNFYDGNSPKEIQIRELADNLYKRVDWPWALNAEGRLSMGWSPEHGFISSDWQAYNEAQILLLLAMGSPTHPLPASAWDNFMSTSKVVEMNGQKSLEFGPLFGHQYTQVWMDYRGIKDATNQRLGFDYFENSRRAAIAQHEYAVANPKGWKGYSSLDWGLTASDGPGDVVKNIDGKPVEFKSYNARGFPNAPDDGTIAPTAAASSLPFVPELVLPTLKHWFNDRPEIVGPFGFQDAFNPTFDATKPSGWVDGETIGIDQGPILLMTENYRTGMVWNRMKKDPYLSGALKKAGFK